MKQELTEIVNKLKTTEESQYSDGYKNRLQGGDVNFNDWRIMGAVQAYDLVLVALGSDCKWDPTIRGWPVKSKDDGSYDYSGEGSKELASNDSRILRIPGDISPEESKKLFDKHFG